MAAIIGSPPRYCCCRGWRPPARGPLMRSRLSAGPPLIQLRARELQNPGGHRQSFTQISTPTWRLFHCGQCKTASAA
eukprot:3293829-Pyramimonas_sp.AAC.1